MDESHLSNAQHPHNPNSTPNPYAYDNTAHYSGSYPGYNPAGTDQSPTNYYQQPYYQSATQETDATTIHGVHLGEQEQAFSTSGDPEPEKEKSTNNPKHHNRRLILSCMAAALVAGAVGGSIPAYFAGISQTDSDPVNPPATAQTAVVSTTSGDASGIVQQAAPSVVEITTKQTVGSFLGSYDATGAGSGIIISEDGYIVTNDHVIGNAAEVMVRTQDGTEYSAKLVGTDEKTDLAAIKIDAKNLTPATFADSDQVQAGQLAIAIGNPLGTLGGTVTDGIISAAHREISIEGQSMELLQTSAAVNPGNSGGGLFNQSGQLVGIINAKSIGDDVEGLGFAIPSNLVQEVTQELIENGYVSGRAAVGMHIAEISDMRTAFMNGLDGTGIYVVSADNGTGLQPKDQIIRIDNTEIQTSAQISTILSDKHPGDSISIAVLRDGSEQTLSLTLKEQVPETLVQTNPSSQI